MSSRIAFVLLVLVTLSMSLLIAALATSGQEEWQVADAQNTAELFTAQVSNVSLSPDGTMLAGTAEGQICIFTSATGNENCYPTAAISSTGFYETYHNPLVWSPDSNALVFTENVSAFNEPDVWMLNIITGETRDLTDDGVVGNMLSLGDDADYRIDYLPTFAPNGDIYFFRSERKGESIGNSTLTLQCLPVGADEPEQVTNLSLTLPTFSVFFSPAVSPDGTQLAFPVDASDPDAWQDGLWLVDLASGEVRQLTDAGDAHVGVPESHQDAHMATFNPVWTADGVGIVFHTFGFALGTDGDEAIGRFVYVDVATGDVRQVVDLSDFPNQTQLWEQDAPELLLIPHEGAVSADGSNFVYVGYNRDSTLAQITVVPLPPDGSEPTILGKVEFAHVPYVVPNLIMSTNGKALLAGWLYTFE